MKAEDHILAWIESNRPHYDRLLSFSTGKKTGVWSNISLAESAVRLVASAYSEMVRCGDASRDDPYSAAELLEAAKLVAAWELAA